MRNFRVRLHGRIRSGRDARWISLTAAQYNFIDDAARLFYLNGSMFMIPVQGYHRYVGRSATMRIKAAALVPVVDVSGNEMNQGETVTMFNDMCVMAPATLINPAIAWKPAHLITGNMSISPGISTKADLQEPSPSEPPSRNHASAVFADTYRLR